MEKHGTIQVLRRGFDIAGCGHIDVSEAAPEDQRNKDVLDRYAANRLRVVPQLRYTNAKDFEIDLVLFINGIPVATVEVKTDFTQSAQAAIEQYRQDRLPVDPRTKRKEPLLTFKRGAVVHFAMSDSEIWMSTKLAGENSFFLPFNKGNEGRAGKSQQLTEALLKGVPIIVVTIQTFPYAMEAILTEQSLKDRNFAVIIDEAHASQTGATASKLQATLALTSKDGMGKMTIEELLTEIQNSRTRPKNVSQFAFTATPKHSTMMLFGRPRDPSKPASDDNLPDSFHKYPMRQAIEEKFILDVLEGYLPYKTAFNLGKEMVDTKRVDGKAAKRALAKWMTLHPTNVVQKVQFIMQHFAKNVAHLLDGKAKAMVVTSSRAAAVRYKKAFDAFIQDNPEYQDIQLFTSAAQMFDERGRGFILKGRRAQTESRGRHPYMTMADAREIIESVLAAYKAHHKTLPARVLVLKTSRFKDEEAEGIIAALDSAGTAMRDLVWVQESYSARLLRDGNYPVMRGTFVDLGGKGLLYTSGSMPYYGTYPGEYSPNPLLLCPHESCDSTVEQLAEEVLSMTKLNWNSTQMNQRLPIPIRAARKVGEVLKYVGEGQAVSTDYRKYI